MKRMPIYRTLALLGLVAVVAATSPRTYAFTFAVWLDGEASDGGNAIPGLLNSTFGAGSATLVSMSDLDTPGFLNSFDALVMSRFDSAFGVNTLDAAAITNIQSYVGLAGDPGQGGVAVFTNDAADTFVGSGSGDPADLNTTQLFINMATFAAASGHGYVGEYNGGAMAFESNANGSALGLLTGDAGLLGFQSIGSFVYAPGPVGAGNPIDAGVTFPFTDGETSTFGMVVTGADPNNIVDVYSVDNPDFDGVPAVVANKFVISGGHPGVPDAASTGLLCLFSLVGLAAARRWVRR